VLKRLGGAASFGIRISLFRMPLFAGVRASLICRGIARANLLCIRCARFDWLFLLCHGFILFPLLLRGCRRSGGAWRSCVCWKVGVSGGDMWPEAPAQRRNNDNNAYRDPGHPGLLWFRSRSKVWLLSVDTIAHRSTPPIYNL